MSAPDRSPARFYRRINPAPVLAGLLGVLLLAVTCWIGSVRSRAHTALGAAQAALSHDELEAAQAALRSLPAPWSLSVDTRRTAAELFFRLGEDGKANALLAGQPFKAGDPQDERLKELNIRAQEAARLLKQADASRTPPARLTLVRRAEAVVPESPALLQRLVLEELLVMTATHSPALSAQFESDYAELRRKAPRRAEELKARLREAVGAGN